MAARYRSTKAGYRSAANLSVITAILSVGVGDFSVVGCTLSVDKGRLSIGSKFIGHYGYFIGQRRRFIGR
ncbi:hypothetical protein OYT88_11310 [Sporolactobacillus sp. CQH2019]|uniref:hypothetical protein n=1 Tax=Sporolactobacillus sp. CQH2019 TaxID=3023512 RepID=UPI0023681129|nr:hypothetical protein [Sporolactobacillus sp. CQH2019]MDD9149140.1 hypothetical protein [Sporolactobacillus sp. CQH2019]